jgi:hypothetical protein
MSCSKQVSAELKNSFFKKKYGTESIMIAAVT